MPELSRRIPLATVPVAGRAERIVATPAERAALTERFGILGIDRLQATLRLAPEADGVVRVVGDLTADVVQACVVTFEPVAQHVAEAVAWRLLPSGREPADGPDDADELATDGVADLGEAVAEQLSLALDPYPRAPGATLPISLVGDSEPEAAASVTPFAALARRLTRAPD